MFHAYQIVDFHNPISVQYMEYSRKSFECVKDILTIEPYQCFTPDTQPRNIDLSWKKRTLTEQACLYTHYSLATRLKHEDRFIIMEHDAYLWPNKQQEFRELLKLLNSVVWVVGIAAECYTMDQEVAKFFCNQVENDRSVNARGPLGHLFDAGNKFCRERESSLSAVWPVSWHETNVHNKLCVAKTCTEAHLGKGIVLDAPVTQNVKEDIGVTIKRKKTISRKNNPNVHFT